MLQSLLTESDKRNGPWAGWADLKIFSPRATADESILKLMCSGCLFEVLGSDRNGSQKKVQRTIASDRELVELLIRELGARGVDLSPTSDDQVILLSEWDTSYGRALPLTFASAVLAAQKKAADFPAALRTLSTGFGQWPPQVRRVMYMGGLDGNRPGGEAATEDAKTDAGSRAAGKQKASKIERPEGERQLAYVRRVAEQLELEPTGEVKAIGVLGSDVYDKLLLLQALRPRFPNALMFTTDLDARLLHPSETTWARNLIVASSFPLDVPRKFRDSAPQEWAWHARGQPPFRDSYQTAAYFAVLRALASVGPAEIKEASEPWIYEIGRTRAHRLPSTGQTDGDQVMYITRELAAYRTWGPWIGSGLAAVLLVLFAFLVHHTAFGPQLWKDRNWRIRAGWMSGYMAAVGLLILVVVRFSGGPPEPLTWIEGISIWPTEIIRAVAGLLAVFFLVRAHQRIRETNQSIREAYSIGEGSEIQNDLPKGFLRRAACLLVKGPFGQANSLAGLWSRYECCSAPANRWPRVLLLWAVYFVFALCLFSLLGMPTIPYRGDGSRILDRTVTMLTVGLQLLLIFYVLETILLTERLVREMVRDVEKNPPEFLGGWPGEPSEPERRAWFTIDLTARLTSTAGSLIVYPFVVLALMIFSRLSYFDSWDWPISLIVVFGVNGLFALGSGVLLSRTAVRVRGRCHEALRRVQFDAVRKGENDRAEAVGKVMGEVENEQRGAFVPLQQHPVLGAIALPSSSVLLALLLDFLDRAG